MRKTSNFEALVNAKFHEFHEYFQRVIQNLFYKFVLQSVFSPSHSRYMNDVDDENMRLKIRLLELEHEVVSLKADIAEAHASDINCRNKMGQFKVRTTMKCCTIYRKCPFLSPASRQRPK